MSSSADRPSEDQPSDDRPSGRPGDTGDGDNYDPEVHDPDVSSSPSGGTSTGRADGSGGQGDWSSDGADGADDARASEIDDLTEGVDRPPMSADDLEEAVAEAVDDAIQDIDFSDVDVGAALAERDEFKSMAQRIQADFDNFRRQATVRAQADADRATGRLAEALLPVLDAAEAAYLRHPEEVGPLLNQMLVELRRHGLETLDLDGRPFDPEVADAVAHEPGEGGEAVVSEVLRSGYRWKGKTLRPAMVKTSD